MTITSPIHKWSKEFLQEISLLFPFIKGSLTEIRKPCIRPNCSACKRGDKHPAFILTFRKDGKTHCRYVSKAQVSEIRKAIENGRKLEQMMALACEKLLDEFRFLRKMKKK